MRRAVLLLACAGLMPAVGWADGAFPDSFSIFAPADQPHRLLLATNFGLLISEDDGTTWFLVCENAMNAPYASLYSLGPPPTDKIGVVSQLGFTSSTDNACTWTPAVGGIADTYVEDVFLDPNDPNQVLAIATAPSDGGPQPTALYTSSNGGVSFGSSWLYEGDAGVGLVSVEISRSSPHTVYLALFQHSPDSRAILDRSDDFGQTWQSFDISGAVGTRSVRIATIDPLDSSRVYLRVVDSLSGQDALAIVTDGGASVAIPLQLSVPMSGFFRRANGELLVMTATAPSSGSNTGAFRSTDNGQSFQPWGGNYHLRAATERAGTLFVVGDNFKDSFAVAQSTDDGNTLHPLLQYANICGLKSCGGIVAACTDFFGQLSTELGIQPNACAPKPHGCGCGAPAGTDALAGGLLSLLVLARRRLRRRQRPLALE